MDLVFGEEFQVANYLMSIAGGHIVSRFFSSLYQLGILEQFQDDQPKHYNDIAKIVGCDPECLHSLLRFFLPYRLFNEVSLGTYTKTSTTKLFMKGGPLYSLMDCLTSDKHYMLHKNILETLRTGQNKGPEALGCKTNNFYESFSDPVWEKGFTSCMDTFNDIALPNILASVDFSPYKTIVDVGGSHGKLLRQILGKYPSIQKGINFDLPEVNKGKVNEKRLEFVSGNFFETIPRGDCIIMKTILHNWKDEDAKAILQVCSNALEDGGHLYIFDSIVDPHIINPHAIWLDISMRHIFGSKERSLEEMETLIQGKFKIHKVIKEVNMGCMVLTKI
ncbi:O-methyltransferase family 2 protein [Tieghemostelium lacteum]|uniref:O-methyltransferase family 2 protein n=1 Tax=Tieghemostelium lacteum TaxID=361077 RepID=A0A151ZED0_TIELA|nr:O-methyltransferase family 2 protein [Tieghemostelium lacteum]|eukprot:KYQ92313.1 O-methyltransferase family 2 protein [Tieghemostelium lacteum]